MMIQSTAFVPVVVSLETILQHHIDVILSEYEENVCTHLLKKQFDVSEEVLTDFCYVLLDLSDGEQLFIVRVFFTGLVTTVLHTQIKKHQLHAHALELAYETISQLDSFTHMTEYIFFIPTFIDNIQKQLEQFDKLDYQNKYVNEALRLIQDHIFDRFLTVQWLADQLHISTTYLSSLFRICLGQTVHQYIMERKMNEIAFDIRYSSMTISQIREKYGYHNSSQFIQSFKKCKGITPLQYQRAWLN